jgi:hypothetical protein
VDPKTGKRAVAAGVTSWRYERLRRAGVAAEPAEALSHDRDFDLHALIELIERGCPPGLAARILAPLDTERPQC